MYLIGDGSISYPWQVPKDFPTDALHPLTKERFLLFIKNEQWTLDWDANQRGVYYFNRICLPYIADWTHKKIKQSHFNSLTDKLYETFDDEYWEEKTVRTVRLTMQQPTN